MKKNFAGLLVCALLFSALLPAHANAKSFSDVNEGDWYYNQIMIMTEKGLFEGKGNNLFCPNDTMTEAEFLTVLLRALYPEEDITSAPGEEWWQGAFDAAVKKGFIEKADYEGTLSVGGMGKTPVSASTVGTKFNKPIPRQKMAFFSVKALNTLGETNLQPYTFIIDVKSADEAYQESIRLAYGAGILIGDNEGFFNPKATLTRAEASTVLYRIIEKSARAQVDFSGYAPITIYEGVRRTNRNAQAGDTFVKLDGTKVVIQKGPNGIVGEGQCVAPDVGLVLVPTQEIRPGRIWVDIREKLVDSTGGYLHNQDYRINDSTGEGHWSKEIEALCKAYPKPDRDGAYAGEVSTDPHKLWVWDFGMWTWNFTVVK